MKAIVVGASGYLGSELLHQARAAGHEALGTSRSESSDIMFDLNDEKTWPGITAAHPDLLIWSAWPRDKYAPDHDPFVTFLDSVIDTKLVYVSTDALLCPKTLQAESALGDYARRKQTEHSTAAARPNTAIFMTGPIYGSNSAGTVDERTQRLLDSPEETHEFWNNVYKTFVPVRGLAKTIINNLQRTGEYLVGPKKRLSYYEFYRSRFETHGLPPERIQPSQITAQALGRMGMCMDTSYRDKPNRLWE